MEHRWGRRISIDLPVQVTTADSLLMTRARLVNVSISGAFMNAECRPRTLSRVQVLFESTLNPQGDVFSIAAYVARSYLRGFAVEWCDLDSRALTEFLRAAAARVSDSSAKTETPTSSHSARPTTA